MDWLPFLPSAMPSPTCTRRMREHVCGSSIRRLQLAFCLRVCYCHRGLLARRGRSAHRCQLPDLGSRHGPEVMNNIAVAEAASGFVEQ